MYFYSKLKVALAKYPVSWVAKPTPLVVSGPGCTLEVPSLLHYYGGRRVLVVTGPHLVRSGLLDPLLHALEAAGLEVTVYSDVQSDPTFATAQDGVDLCRSRQCDSVVALGGGSVLDAAKAIAAAAPNCCTAQSLQGMLKVKKPRLPFIAVPTTAGTGSETTVAAVLSHPETHRKATILDPRLVPDVAVLDPALTVGLPPRTTAATALDALTHALEAFLSTYATPETDRMALCAVQLLFGSLEGAILHPADLTHRANLLLGSFYAGQAFTRTYVGYVHAFAHSIGGHWGVPHGLACAVLLPLVLDFYRPVCTERFGVLYDVLDLGDPNALPEDKADAFVAGVLALNRAAGLPDRLDSFPQSGVETVCQEAFEECHGTYPVPRYFTKSQALDLLRQVAAHRH